MQVKKSPRRSRNKLGDEITRRMSNIFGGEIPKGKITDRTEKTETPVGGGRVEGVRATRRFE